MAAAELVLLDDAETPAVEQDLPTRRAVAALRRQGARGSGSSMQASYADPPTPPVGCLPWTTSWWPPSRIVRIAAPGAS